MKVAHIADCHIGYKAGDKIKDGTNLRELDGYEAFDTCIEEMIEKKVDVIMLAGDLFHSPNPSVKNYERVLKTLQKIPENIEFYCITGNHDTFDNKTTPSAVLPINIPKVNLFTFDEPYKVITKDNVVFHLVSHHNFSEQDETMKELKPHENKINVLVTHGSLYDQEKEILLKSNASPREIVIPQSVIDLDWDLILLGHIHKRQKVGKNAYYPGSLLRRGWADDEGDRGWILWDIQDKNNIKKTENNIWQRPQIEFIIDCSEISTIEIEEQIKEFLVEVTENYEFPIIRILFDKISLDKRHSLNWKQFNIYTNKCLTFSTKYNVIDLEISTLALEEASSTRNMDESFESFWDRHEISIREEIREDTKKEVKEYIEKGKEETLNEEN